MDMPVSCMLFRLSIPHTAQQVMVLPVDKLIISRYCTCKQGNYVANITQPALAE